MDFPGNSIHQSTTKPETNEPKQETEKKVVNKVISGSAIRREKTMFSRLRDLIVPEGKSLYETVVQGVLAPALKDMLNDAVIRGVETMIYGEPRSTSRRSSLHRGPVGSTSHISYNHITNSAGPRENRPTMSSRGRARHDFAELELPTRVEAEAILQQMDMLIDRYGNTSVSDLYQMVGETASYTDERWGWYSLHGADVRRTRSGAYLLILPDTEPLA